MANIGRNSPCPCGSGKKYKKCCEAKAAIHPRPQSPSSARSQPSSPPEPLYVLDDDNLDEISNQAVDLIHERRFDEALALCQRLRDDYPDTIDWLDRSAMLHEARGDLALACDFYKRALAFTELPRQRHCFDDEGRAYFQTKISELEGKLQSS
jgi:tetratricopeptide (TPR) repeat protein